MTDFILAGAGSFPRGTSVGVYPVSNWPSGQWPLEGPPPGSVTERQVIGSDDTATFTTLVDGTPYFAVALVDGKWRYVNVLPSAGGGGGGAASFIEGAGSPVGSLDKPAGTVYADTVSGRIYFNGAGGPDGWTVSLDAVLGALVAETFAGVVLLTDRTAEADGASQNGVRWMAADMDGDQQFQIQVGAPGAPAYINVFPDGGFNLSDIGNNNRASFYVTAAGISEARGAEGDWAFGTDGHIYHHGPSGWVEKL